MNNRKLQVWLPILFALVMITGMYLGFRLRENTLIADKFFKPSGKSPVQEVIDLIERRYVDSIQTDSIGDAAIEEMLKHLDPHSVFIPSKQLAAVNADLAGNFEGIGVEFQIFDDTVHVVQVVQDGPSAKAGIQIGDKIIKADSTVIAGKEWGPEEIRKKLRGKGGTPVSLTLLRKGKELVLSVTRGRVPLPSLDAAYLIDKETGFIRLNKFSETTFREFMTALEDLQKQGMKKLILDLRSNGGGLLSAAVDMADEFLSGNKLIVYTQGNKMEKQEFRAKRDGLFETGPLVLLMDEFSASASEVLAGALQDYDRATIIGRRSFGKGLVQEQYTLSNGSALRLTVARYFTPLGRSIQKPYENGIEQYKAELNERYHNGEVSRTDTTFAPKGKTYTTAKGKKLYGNGGITPDVLVGIDTNSFNDYAAYIASSSDFSKTVYQYYLNHQTELSKLKDPSQLAAYVRADASLPNLFRDIYWERAKRWEKENAKTDSLSENSRRNPSNAGSLPLEKTQNLDSVLERFQNQLARIIWRNKGYFQSANQYDQTVQKAIQLIGSVK